MKRIHYKGDAKDKRVKPAKVGMRNEQPVTLTKRRHQDTVDPLKPAGRFAAEVVQVCVLKHRESLTDT